MYAVYTEGITCIWSIQSGSVYDKTGNALRAHQQENGLIVAHWFDGKALQRRESFYMK